MAQTVLVLLTTASAAVSDDPCSGHGSLNATTSLCDCQNPWPSAGESGWTGINCSVPIWGGKADGDELTAPCTGSGCAHLAPGSWACFALKFPWVKVPEPPEEEWHYLAVQLNRTNDDPKADPDLFGLFEGGSRGMVQPNFTTTLKGADFRETSSGLHPLVVKKIRKADFGLEKDYEGAYICVHAYSAGAPVDFSLRAFKSRCPGDFDPDSGTPLMCQVVLAAPACFGRLLASIMS